MTPEQVNHALANARTEQEFDSIVADIESTYRVTSAVMSHEGCGAKVYGSSLRVTYQYNLAFHVSVLPDYVGTYRPNW